MNLQTPVEITRLSVEAGSIKDRQKKLQLLAEDFCNIEEIANNLCYVSDYRKFCWYNEEQGHWKLLNEEESFFYHRIKDNRLINITKALMKDFIYNVSFVCKMNRRDYYSDYIALEDCLLNTLTFETEDFDKNKWAFYKFHITKEQLKNIDDPLPDDSRFKQFIKEILIGKDSQPDESLVMLVQEMFGYTLSDTIKAEATFFLKGDRGANGKGVLISLLQSVVGKDFCTVNNLKTLSKNQFAFNSLVGKKINISEENEGDSIDSSVLKTLVSADEVRVEGKFKDSFSARLKLKYIFTTNQMPKFTNFDTALRRRIKIIPFDRHFTEEERDFDLKEKLAQEFHLVSLWALQGLKRLTEKNFHFTHTEYSDELLEEELQDNNSCLQFFHEYYVVDESSEGVFCSTFYPAYVQWCADSGRKAVSKQRMGKDLRKFLQVESKQKWDPDEQRPNKLYPFKIKDERPKLEF